MKYTLTLTLILAIYSLGFSQSTIDSQLKIRNSNDSYIAEQLSKRLGYDYAQRLKTVSPERYNFYLTELLYSYELVYVDDVNQYQELIGYDYVNDIEKTSPNVENVSDFSIYDYRFMRHQEEDIIYKIPNNESALFNAVKIFSKNKFKSKL